MDLSNSLSKILKWLFKGHFSDCNVTLYKWSNRFIVVSACGDASGSGSSSHWIMAFLKSFVELGEVLVARKIGLNNRSGIAGGIFYSTAIERAKEELLERDAFLFHFRSGTPFCSVTYEGEIVISELRSLDKSKKIIMVFNRDYFQGSYLKFGMGCSSDFNVAIEKAISEYNVMELNHSLFPNWFEVANNNYDLHHKYSRESINIEKIKKLIQSPHREVCQELNKNLWKIQRLESPICFFKYIYVEHPDLIRIEFGKQEEDGSYHPFW